MNGSHEAKSVRCNVHTRTAAQVTGTSPEEMKYKNDDHVGITFGVVLVLTALVVAGSLAAIVLHFSGLTDAFINSFA